MVSTERRAWEMIGPIVGIVVLLASSAHAQSVTDYHRALDIVERSLAAHGGLARIRSAGGFEMTLQGTFDLATRLQGRSPFRPEPTPITERIVYDAAANRITYDLNWYNYYTSNQDLREVYDEHGRVLFIDKRNRNGGWLPRETVADSRERLTRMLPQMLLADALANRGTLRYVGSDRVAGKRVDTVSYTTAGGDLLMISIGTRDRLVDSASTVIEMPLLGDSVMSWQWSDYETLQESLVVPAHLRVTLGDKMLKDVSVTVRTAVDQSAFRPPDGIEVADPPDDISPLSEFVPYGQRPPQVEEIVENVYMVTNLRPGFRLLFVEFRDFVLAVDAPTGWYEMSQLPPMNWSYGDSIAALGHKYKRAISETVPGKPVRHVVLTHHHSDHIGGLRAFADAGVTFHAGAAAASVARSAFDTRATMSGDAWPDSLTIPDIETVRSEQVIADDSMEVRLIELPADNPKADNYLVVYLPKQKLLYATAFIYPVPEEAFPPQESIPLSIYFVEWLDNSGLEIDHLYNVHAMGRVEEWQLEEIRRIAAGED